MGLTDAEAEDFAGSQVERLLVSKDHGASDWTLRRRARDRANWLRREHTSTVALHDGTRSISTSPEALAEGHFLLDEIMRILSLVPAPHRMAFLRHHLDGCTTGQIARDTDRSDAAIRQAILRVRQFLARELVRIGWFHLPGRSDGARATSAERAGRIQVSPPD